MLKQCSISTILVFVGQLGGSLLVILLKDFSYKAVFLSGYSDHSLLGLAVPISLFPCYFSCYTPYNSSDNHVEWTSFGHHLLPGILCPCFRLLALCISLQLNFRHLRDLRPDPLRDRLARLPAKQRMDSRLDLFRAVYAEYREDQRLQLLSAFSLKDTHLLSGSFQFYECTLAAQQQNQSIRHTVHALTGEFKGLPTGGPDCFHKLLLNFIFPHPASIVSIS